MTRTYATPHFVREVDVSYAGKSVMRADVDFSISENPNFRFYFVPGDGGELQAKVVDNQDLAFATSVRLDAARGASRRSRRDAEAPQRLRDHSKAARTPPNMAGTDDLSASSKTSAGRRSADDHTPGRSPTGTSASFCSTAVDDGNGVRASASDVELAPVRVSAMFHGRLPTGTVATIVFVAVSITWTVPSPPAET